MAPPTSQHIQKIFSKAVAHLQHGKFLDARKEFIKLSKQIPQSAVIWYNLGLCYQNLQQHHKAIEVYLKCSKIAPNNVDGWANLSISYKELNDIEKAKRTIEKALKIDPKHPRALNLLGSIQAEEGDFDAARQSLNDCLSADPTNHDAKINLANLEFSHGDLSVSEQITDDLYSSAAHDFKVQLLKGRLLITQKNFNDASPIVAELEKKHPENEEVLRLGLSFRESIRDHFGAIKVAEKLLTDFPDDAKAMNSIGGAYFQLDGISKAKDYYQQAVSNDPDNAEYENNLGLAHSSLGDKEKAEAHYRRSLELNPQHAEAYRNIATMKKFVSIDDPDAIKVLDLWQNKESLEELQTIKLAFALGKIYDDCGLHTEAFDTYQAGNDLKFKESRIDLDQYYRHIDTISEILTHPPAVVSEAEHTNHPVFVLGMPRSGTTLIEQVLSRHSLVTGCGELPCIEKAITRLEKRPATMRSYPGDFLTIGKNELEEEAHQYLLWVKRLHDLETPFFVDKMPFNFAHVWLIKSLFPESPIVHCRRHPLDVITSNYFQLYGSDISFVYNLTALANYYVRYHRITTHWNQVFKDEIYNVQYEKFVADAENETRNLILGAGLQWEETCLDTKKSNTAVRTASIWQVRQGIYTSSRERWRKYEKQLKEAIEILAKENILDSDGQWIAF